MMWSCATGLGGKSGLQKDIDAASKSAGKWSDYNDYDSSGPDGYLQDVDTLLIRDVSDTNMASTGSQKELPYSEVKANLANSGFVQENDSPTFGTVNTGQGANELYGMDQGVKTTDDVTFNSVDLAAGPSPGWLAEDSSTNEVGTFDFKIDAATAGYASKIRFYVDESGGEDVLYMELDGENTRIELNKNILIPTGKTFTVGATEWTTTGDEISGDAMEDADADGTTKGSAAFSANDFNATSGVVSIDYTNSQKASTTQSGMLEELTIASEVDTGTSVSKAVTPDSLAGSNYGEEVVGILVFDDSESTATGDGAGDVFFRIPSKITGWNLVEVAMMVQTSGTTGNLDVMIYNVSDSVDMLSTAMRIETGETDTSTSAQPGTINTSFDDVATGDHIRIDVDSVQSTAAKGLYVELTFRLP